MSEFSGLLEKGRIYWCPHGPHKDAHNDPIWMLNTLFRIQNQVVTRKSNYHLLLQQRALGTHSAKFSLLRIHLTFSGLIVSPLNCNHWFSLLKCLTAPFQRNRDWVRCGKVLWKWINEREKIVLLSPLWINVFSDFLKITTIFWTLGWISLANGIHCVQSVRKEC